MYSEMYGGGEWVKELRGKGMESAREAGKEKAGSKIPEGHGRNREKLHSIS